MLNRQNATQIAIITVGMLGTSFGIVGLPASAYENESKQNTASETTVNSLNNALESNEIQQNIEVIYEVIYTGEEQEESATEGSVTEGSAASDHQSVEHQSIEHQSIEHQSIEHQSVESWLLDRLNQDKQTLAEQKEAAIAQITEAIASDISEVAPTAATLGGPISLDTTATTFIDPTSTLNLAAVSSAFSVDPTSVPALQAALSSNNELTRLYAADTLWTLTGEADLVLPTLLAATNSQNVETRELALSAIAQLGQAALPTVPVLNDIIQNSDSLTDNRTRQIAQDVLTVVNSENRPATMLGILAKEVQRRGGLPALLRTLSRLW